MYQNVLFSCADVQRNNQLMLRENYKVIDVSVKNLLSIKVYHKNTIFSAILPVKNMGVVNSETINPLKLKFGYSYFYPMPYKRYKFGVNQPTPIFWSCLVFSDNDS